MFHSGRGTEFDGLYPERDLDAEASRRKKERDNLLTLQNLAKLPSKMWKEHVRFWRSGQGCCKATVSFCCLLRAVRSQLGGVDAHRLDEMIKESRHLSEDMPDSVCLCGLPCPVHLRGT